MAKIEFDGSKVKGKSPVTHAELEAAIKKASFMIDEESKKAISDLLGTVRSRPKPVSKGTMRYGTYSSPARDPLEEREREARRLEEVRRHEAELKRRAEEAAKRREEELNAELFRQVSKPPDQMYHQTQLQNETAVISLNTAKACVILRAMFCRSLVEQISREIPEPKRSWNGRDGVFEFHPSVMPQLKSILKDYYKDVQVLGLPKAIPATKFDQLLAKLDVEDKKKIYRILASKYHPDVGGDKDIMILINQCFKEK